MDDFIAYAEEMKQELARGLGVPAQVLAGTEYASSYSSSAIAQKQFATKMSGVQLAIEFNLFVAFDHLFEEGRRAMEEYLDMAASGFQEVKRERLQRQAERN